MAEKNSPLLRCLEQELRFLTEIGAEFMFAPDGKRQSPPAGSGAVGEAPQAGMKQPGRPIKPTDEKTHVLKDVESRILSCTLCRLSQERNRAVPGEGSYNAALMFVGEGPGADEDIQGRPFVGKAGQLLTKIIAAMGFDRQEVYITNVVKCRPPKNRTPARDEIERCRPYLLTQIEYIVPQVIVCLGKSATDFFLPSTAGISNLRGKFIEYGNILVMPTFHPSYLIRNEGSKEFKKLVWQDMQQVMAALGRK